VTVEPLRHVKDAIGDLSVGVAITRSDDVPEGISAVRGQTEELRVLGSYVEGHVDADTVAGPLASELRAMAGWLGLEDVSVARRGSLARALVAAVRA